MFLQPASVPRGEKVLRIIDFLANILQRDHERTVSDMGGSARLVVSYGQQRPRLESVTLTQWVIANTRIFHTLLFANKLPTAHDVKEYLAYTVKVMELASKYEWVSVLKFDDEYRQLQATYAFPWSYDSPHLHEVALVPKPLLPARPSSKAAGATNVPPSNSFIASHSSTGRPICRKFNTNQGCQRPTCSFLHVCNKKQNGKACEASHPSCRHPSPSQ